jgi:phosphoacetylglucosamine mutase
MYTDYPSKQTKLHVSRSKFKTINADRICLEPHGLQTSINQIVSNHKNARAFVRPSGTEDVVRLYVEALSAEEVDTITHQIAQEVTLYAST